MVAAMAPGSVIVDVAAERGGNCALTRIGEAVVVEGVTILGPANLASEVPYHASQMFAKNIVTFLQHLLREGRWNIDGKDEITRDTLITQNGHIVNTKVRELLGLGELPPAYERTLEIDLE
jgi:NAD(P) transhydrogenase subunit alpha